MFTLNNPVTQTYSYLEDYIDQLVVFYGFFKMPSPLVFVLQLIASLCLFFGFVLFQHLAHNSEEDFTVLRGNTSQPVWGCLNIVC